MKIIKDKNTLLLILILTIVLMVGIGITTYMLYRAAYQQQQLRLIELVQSQARLIEAVAAFDRNYFQAKLFETHEKATLNQILQAHQKYRSASRSGEFTLAKREGDKIHFLIRHQYHDQDLKQDQPALDKYIMGSDYALPMQLALEGNSGVMVGKDYRGVRVLAAYEPIAILDYGMVSKIDLAEIRSPFIRAAQFSFAIGGLLVLAATFAFVKITGPMIKFIVDKENQLRLLINSTGEGIYSIDLEGRCTLANQSCLDILGYQYEQDLLGKNMHDMIHYQYADGSPYPSNKCYINKSFRESKGSHIDTEVFWKKDGSCFPVEYRSFPIFSDNKVIGAVISFADITEKKAAAEKIYQSEEKYRLAMEVTRDGLWDWNILTDEVYYSPGWVHILDMHVPGHLKSTWSDRIHADDKSQVMENLQRHLDGSTSLWQQEHRIKKDDGSYIWVLGRGRVVQRDEQNAPLRMIGTMTDINDKKLSEELIWKQANFDILTALPNRKLLQELLQKSIQRVEREKEQLWLLFLDLDGFKEVNDSLGHHKGDELLLLVSERLQQVVRDSDIVARLGGDEFVVILNKIQFINDIDQIATTIINKISLPFNLDDQIVYTSASIGIANYPNDADDAATLLKFADQSMYAAKQEGKNRYSYFTPALQQGSLLRIKMSAQLREAISNDEFELYYQPIINLATGKISKAEALIRWNHPEKGLLNPGGFIQFAEETGIICDIGNWVFEHVFEQLKRWPQRLKDDFQISINMSPLQLKTNDIKYAEWMNHINHKLILGSHIVLEITEGLLIKDDPIVMKKLINFRDAGVQVAIDDFGTGYSSLSYLKEFDIDYLKIDQSFIRNLKPNSVEASLTEAIVVMAQKLDLQVIAEGIETDNQLAFLKSIQCDYGQGYLISKPLPARQFEKFMAQYADGSSIF